jgi:cytochrome P450
VQDVECSAGIIPKGSRIVLPLNRLNRDPERFDNAETFEPGRSKPQHLAFGAGRHMCVGLHLARTVIRTGVDALLHRLPEWPAETSVSMAPGILGGTSVASLTVPAKALHSC